MWPHTDTMLSSRVCCTVIWGAKRNVLPWKQIFMWAVLAVPHCCSETYPTVRCSHYCVSPPTFLVVQWCPSPFLPLMKGLGIYIHSECKPSGLWQRAFFHQKCTYSLTLPMAFLRSNSTYWFMGVAALGSSWLAVLDTVPIRLPEKVILLAGPHGVINLGLMCGKEHFWMRTRGSNSMEPHRGGSCIARQREGRSAEKQLHRRVEEKESDHPLLSVSYQQDQRCDFFQRTEVAELRHLVVNSMWTAIVSPSVSPRLRASPWGRTGCRWEAYRQGWAVS